MNAVSYKWCTLVFVLISMSIWGCQYQAGEIFNASPNPDEIIYISPGETIELSVDGQSPPPSKYSWTVKSYADIRGHGSGKTFVIDSSKPQYAANIVRITCELLRFELVFTVGSQQKVGTRQWGSYKLKWVVKDRREWEIRTLQDPPVWKGDYYINTEEELLDLSDFKEVDGGLKLHFSAMTDLQGLSHLETVAGGLEIRSCGNLTNLEGLSSHITSIGSLSFYANDELKDFTGLENITSVQEGIWIGYHDSLESLSGLSGLQTVGKDIVIINNYNLENLGLPSLAFVGRGLRISDNIELCEYKAIELREQVTLFGLVEIYDNKDCTSP